MHPPHPDIWEADSFYQKQGLLYSQTLLQEISGFIPEARQFTDAVRTFAYGTDASFYRLNPKMVVKVHSEEEVARILPIAAKHQVPITFRYFPLPFSPSGTPFLTRASP